MEGEKEFKINPVEGVGGTEQFWSWAKEWFNQKFDQKEAEAIIKKLKEKGSYGLEGVIDTKKSTDCNLSFSYTGPDTIRVTVDEDYINTGERGDEPVYLEAYDFGRDIEPVREISSSYGHEKLTIEEPLRKITYKDIPLRIKDIVEQYFNK